MLSRLREMWRMRSEREDLYARAAFWNYKADTYSGTAVSMFINRTLNDHFQRDQFAFFDERLGNVSGLSILDVGCGTGRLSRHLGRQGAQVHAFDFAEKAVDIARKESEGLPVEYRIRSVFEVDEVARYDVVTVLGCLTVACRSREAFSDVMGRLHRSLKPGGRLVMLEPFHANFLHRVLKLAPREVLDIVQQAGFSIDTIKPMHFWPTRLVLTVGETPKWITNTLYPLGEVFLKLTPRAFNLGDYTAISARREQ